jgi:hypothetical protein
VAMLQVTDWYPSEVVTPTATYPKARIVVTAQGRTVVWARVEREIKKVEDVTATEAKQSNKILTVTTDSGEWTATKQGGCGCGDRLRAMRLRQLLA